jgi:hypothetical protein
MYYLIQYLRLIHTPDFGGLPKERLIRREVASLIDWKEKNVKGKCASLLSIFSSVFFGLQLMFPQLQ